MKLRTRRSLRTIGILAAAVMLAVLVPATAYAVHDLQFQLDGDVTAQGGSAQPFDWQSFFNASGQPSPVLPDSSLPGFTSSGFQRDFQVNSDGSFNPADSSTYATGSKDTLNITPGWQCAFANNVNSKVDIMNAYAVAYTNPTPDSNGVHHQILYFGMEKNANTGDNNVGFWFLQSSADCSAASGSNTPWTGNHTNGDILIVSAFTSGGGVSGITAYKWSGDANGFLDPNPAANGGDCKTALGGDTICATTNSGALAINGSITTPWLTANKQDGVGNTLRTTEFFEGGIDLTAASLGNRCFNIFVGDTRSSQSLTATLFDYARGRLGECTVSMTTAPSSNADRTLGDLSSITDTATVVGHTSGGGTAPTPTGTVTFFLCSPTQLTPDSNGTCEDSNGTLVPPLPGSPNPVSVSGTTGTATATSPDAHAMLTTLGKYCFRAHFDAGSDPNYPGQTAETGNPTAECFLVTAVASIRTEQSWLPQDTAFVTASGGATVAGSVTFNLYESANCTGTPVQTFADRPVNSTTGQATTDNAIYYTTATTISWRATFTSTNSVGSGSPSHCETMTVSPLTNDLGS